MLPLSFRLCRFAPNRSRVTWTGIDCAIADRRLGAQVGLAATVGFCEWLNTNYGFSRR